MENKDSSVRDNYETPVFERQESMTFTEEIIEDFNINRSCLQCSGCHGCR